MGKYDYDAKTITHVHARERDRSQRDRGIAERRVAEYLLAHREPRMDKRFPAATRRGKVLLESNGISIFAL